MQFSNHKEKDSYQNKTFDDVSCWLFGGENKRSANSLWKFHNVGYVVFLIIIIIININGIVGLIWPLFTA